MTTVDYPEGPTRGLRRRVVLGARVAMILLVWTNFCRPAVSVWASAGLATIVRIGRSGSKRWGPWNALRNRMANLDDRIAVGTTAVFGCRWAIPPMPGRRPSTTYFDARGAIHRSLVGGTSIDRVDARRLRLRGFGSAVRVRVPVPRATTGDAGCREEVVALIDPLHATKVFGGPFQFASFSNEDHDLEAGFPLQVNVARGSNMFSPLVLSRREATLNHRDTMIVEHHDGAYGIGLRVRERVFGKFFPDKEPDSLGAAPGIPTLNPSIEGRHDLGFQREAGSNDFRFHNSAAGGTGADSGCGWAEVEAGPNPISS